MLCSFSDDEKHLFGKGASKTQEARNLEKAVKMQCPYCKTPDSRVIDSREAEDTVRRRRECPKCEKRFTTYERVEKTDLVVLKKDGRREPFSVEKLKAGVIKACEKRPIRTEKVECLCEEVEMALKKREKTEIPSSVIGELVMKKLKKLDEIAYVRFASVYKEFKNLDELKREIKEL